MKRICNDGNLKEFFRDGLTRTAGELRNHFDLSMSVAYRELKRLNAVPALNKPGHYTLPGFHRMDSNGLFRISGLVFSSKGTLPQTLSFLVENSPAGMTVIGLEKIVKTNAKVQLLNLVKSGKLTRQKIEGEYHYFSSSEEIAMLQKREYEKLSENSGRTLIMETAKSVSLSLVVQILIAFIKHPEFTPKSIALSLVRRGADITTEKVKAVFEKYDLTKKNS